MKTLLRHCVRQASLGLMLFLALSTIAFAQLPRPDHVVVVILENHAYSQIIGSANAPYLNSLANQSHAALFTQSYAVTHPSQPNYIDLYSGCNQGVLLDFLPIGYPFTTANLGRQLLDSGYTWMSYSEDLPSVGSDVETNLAYVRRHNPAANWVGTGQNQIPASTNQPFTAFPTDFDSLPTVCFVAPNLDHDMHDGSVSTGDTWMQDHLDAYAQWAKTHNSLLIVTFDEDDGLIISPNHIYTVFVGQSVVQGHYSGSVSHYSVLRTIEEMYGLPYACNAGSVSTIMECWAGIASAPSTLASNAPQAFVSPNPAKEQVTIHTSTYRGGSVELLDLSGRTLHSQQLTGPETSLDLSDFPSGVYLVRLRQVGGVEVHKLLKE